MQIELRNVCFVRHAKSSWRDPYLQDFDRPLNKRGFRDAPRMAAKMRELEVVPDFILTSPANRAKTTAEYFMKEFGLEEEQYLEDQDLYHAGPEEILEVLRNAPNERRSVFVFGHNPGMTYLANMFAGISIDNVPTCGIFQAKTMVANWEAFDPETSAFVAFYYPKQYFF